MRDKTSRSVKTRLSYLRYRWTWLQGRGKQHANQLAAIALCFTVDPLTYELICGALRTAEIMRVRRGGRKKGLTQTLPFNGPKALFYTSAPSAHPSYRSALDPGPPGGRAAPADALETNFKPRNSG